MSRSESIQKSPSFKIMGILNCTPDSFYDGSDLDFDGFIQKGLKIIEEGAHIIDIGGESSRPGAEGIDEKEELKRVIPIIKRLRKEKVLLSIDTYKVNVAKIAVDEGVDFINDISTGADPKLLEFLSQCKVGYIAMHMQGAPKNMQNSPNYENVIQEIIKVLQKTSQNLLALGFPKEKIIWDPGIGFGKNLKHNLTILKDIEKFTNDGYEVLLGVSRKSFISKICPEVKSPDQRLPGSLAPLHYAYKRGVSIFRVHDVAATKQYLEVCEAIENKA